MTPKSNDVLLKEFKRIYRKEPSQSELNQFTYWYKGFKIGNFNVSNNYIRYIKKTK